MVGIAGSTHNPNGLECGPWALMKKLGQGHPPPNAAQTRSGWRSSFVVVMTLLKTKMELHRLKHKSRQMRGGHDQTVEEQRADSTVTHLTRGRGGIPSGIPLGHMATPEWLWRSRVGPGGTDVLRRDVW